MDGSVAKESIRSEIDKAHACVYNQAFYQGLTGAVTARYQRQLADSIADGFRPVVLELGAGNLQLTRVVRTLFGEEIGLLVALDIKLPLDVSWAAEVNPAQSSHIVLCCGDASRLPLGSETVDLAFHGCVLHHVERPLELIEEIHRVVKRGGRIVYYLPCHPGFLVRVYQYLFSSRRFNRAIRNSLTGSRISFAIAEAVEHRNHYLSLREMIKFVHRSDDVKLRRVPFLSPTWNFRAYEIYSVVKAR